MTLLPRSGAPSTPGSAESSPAEAKPAAAAGESKASPFGAARPVDIAAKEKEVEEKIARQAAEAKEKREAKQAEIKAAREKEAAEKAAGGAAEGDKKGGRGAKSPSGAEPANWRSAKPVSSPKAAVAPALEAIPAVGGGKKAAAPTAAEKKKEAEKKKDFSFAALAVEGGEDDVDEVAEDVEKVKV